MYTGYTVLTGKDQTASLLFLGRAESRLANRPVFPGTSHILASP